MLSLEGACEAQQEGKEGAMGLTLGWLKITHIKPFANKLVNDKVYLVARWCTTNYQREHPREHTRTRVTAKQTGVRVQRGTVSQAIRSRGRSFRPSEELADLAEGIAACFTQSSWSSSKLLRAFNWFTISVNRSQSRQCTVRSLS